MNSARKYWRSLVQAISTLTASAEDMAAHRVQEQLLRPAARAIEAKKPEESEMLVQSDVGRAAPRGPPPFGIGSRG
jgi:hypothetical protein